MLSEKEYNEILKEGQADERRCLDGWTTRSCQNIHGNRTVCGPAERMLSEVLMLTWCMDTSWWVKKSVFAEASVKSARFLEEILWVGVVEIISL